MENRSWEDDLKNKLEDYKPEGLQPDWDFFSGYLSVHEQISVLEEDEIFDENLKESISTFEAPLKTEGWDRVDATLNKADQQFDENIRNKINHFEPKYNPRTWPLLLQSLSGAAFLRAKLLAFKVVEVAAVFLLLFTVFKMGQMGKLPFETALFSTPKESLDNSSNIVIAENLSTGTETNINSDKSEEELSDVSNNTASLLTLNSTSSPVSEEDNTSLINTDESDVVDNSVINVVRHGKSVNPISFDLLPIKAKKKLIPDHHVKIAMVTPNEDEVGNNGKKGLAAVTSMFNKLSVANFLSTALSPIKSNHHNVLPKPHYIKQRSKTFTEFGIVSQVDYNLLRMPEDRLFNSGRQIIFPQKGIPSANLGGGFSFALVHPKWALETGMVYSPKNFKPGRHIVVGDSFDQGSIEFQAMRLQLVSVPLNFRYRFDNKGAFKYYGIAGCGLHIIAQSNIDLMIKYEFPSLSFNEDPTKDPLTASVIRDTKHISEHIRDGAPFSTKSFFSINAGAGIEYSISENKTLFLQSAVQYQVPNLRFSNINGKHIRSVSLQAGVRTPLGK